MAFFFPGIAIFTWVSWHEAPYAFQIGERSEATPWRPLTWVLNAVVALSSAPLQGVSELAKSAHAWRDGTAFEHEDTLET